MKKTDPGTWARALIAVLRVVIMGVVAAGVMILVSQVLKEALRQPELRVTAMFLLISLLAVVVHHFFKQQR
jgi:hypothetical protein